MLMTKTRHERVVGELDQRNQRQAEDINELVRQIEGQRVGIVEAERVTRQADERLAALTAKLDRYAATVRVGDRRIATRSGSEVEVVSVTDRHNDPDGKLSVGVRFINPYDPQKPHRWFTYSRVRGWALA